MSKERLGQLSERRSAQQEYTHAPERELLERGHDGTRLARVDELWMRRCCTLHLPVSRSPGGAEVGRCRGARFASVARYACTHLERRSYGAAGATAAGARGTVGAVAGKSKGCTFDSNPTRWKRRTTGRDCRGSCRITTRSERAPPLLLLRDQLSRILERSGRVCEREGLTMIPCGSTICLIPLSKSTVPTPSSGSMYFCRTSQRATREENDAQVSPGRCRAPPCRSPRAAAP